jgi:hypothetical protein
LAGHGQGEMDWWIGGLVDWRIDGAQSCRRIQSSNNPLIQ